MNNPVGAGVKVMKYLIVALVSTFLLSSPSHVAAEVSVGRYDVDPNQSSVSFRIRQLGLMAVEGRFKSFSGTIELAEPFDRTKVVGRVEVDSIDTGIRKRDEHLRSSAFFEVADFALMSFESTHVDGTLDNFRLEGKLTIKGVTHPVRFHGTRTGNPAAGDLVITATATVNRHDFGITYNPLINGATVITLKIVAHRK